jgi:hypothetical protein
MGELIYAEENGGWDAGNWFRNAGTVKRLFKLSF